MAESMNAPLCPVMTNFSPGNSEQYSPPPSDDVERQVAAAKSLIEQRTIRMIELIRNNAWDSPELIHIMAKDFKTVAPDAFLEALVPPKTTTRREHLDSYRAFKESHPDYDNIVTSVAADVDMKEGTARCWVTMDIVGHPPSTRKESISCVYHKYNVRDGWKAVKQVVLRGPQVM